MCESELFGLLSANVGWLTDHERLEVGALTNYIQVLHVSEAHLETDIVLYVQFVGAQIFSNIV